MKFLYNDPTLRDRRRALRNYMTKAEQLIWERIRKRRLCGYRFLRQYSIGPYILDFYCVERRFGIEIDGGYHISSRQSSYDGIRTEFLAEHHVRIVRIMNEEIFDNLDRVIGELAYILSPSKKGEAEGVTG